MPAPSTLCKMQLMNKMNKNFTNQEIAELLRQVAASYEILNGNRFKISAYDRAAVSVEHSTSEIKDIWDDGKLEEVPGVGKNIADHLDELFRTGKVKHFEKLFRKLPPAMFVFLKIPGVGAKTAYALSKELKIFSEENALEKLRKALKGGRLQRVKNFGEKSEKKIFKAIALLKKGETREKRMLLPYADAIANEIIIYLKRSPEVIQADPLGSLRRAVATIGDIDISVSTNNPQKVIDHFFKFPKIKSILGKGKESLGRVILFSGQQVDIRLSKPENYGAMLQYFTGSKQHNISLREFSLKKGLSLSEYGIKPQKKVKNSKLKVQSYNSKLKIYEFADEKDFYEVLGLDWIPPELREDSGEIEAALRSAQGKLNGLPNLVEIEDIKGDLHIHSNFQIESSHDIGESSPEEMIKMAEILGYQYLGFSEHNPSLSRHSGKQVIDLIERRNQYFEHIKYSYENAVKKRKQKLLVRLICGLEIDIKPDGQLAVPEKALDLLDYAIVSVHSSMEMGRKEMTKRIINGLSHPKARILGHPTGRLLNRREGYELDWEEIFDYCLKNQKILEISSLPERLDLPDMLVREAVKRGIKLVIDSDSHSVGQMNLLKYGVFVARRGWAEQKDVINTLSLAELSDILFK